MKQHATELIPEQEKGSATNTEKSRSFDDSEEAKAFYEEVKGRLVDINSWHSYAGAASAKFFLCNATGQEVQRLPQKGDHFKIDIPGPGPATGDGWDWVQIEAIEEIKNEEEESTVIRVRPATNPTNNRSDVAHFFSEAATSNFLVTRKDNKVTAAVLGRNETPNTDAEKLADKARNAAVAAGAVTAFSKLQWKNLVKGLMEE